MIACEVLGLFLGHEWIRLAQGYLVLDLSKDTKWTHHNGVEKCYHRDTSIQKHVASQGSHCGEDFHPSTPRRWHCRLFTPGWYIIQVHRSCVCGCMNTILSAVNSLQQNFSWSWHDSVTPGRWCGYVQRHSSPCRETSLYYDLSTLLIMHGHTSISLASHTLYVVIIMVIYKCIAQEPVRSIHAAAHYAGLVWS